MEVIEKYIEKFIFWSRWLQMPVYLGLIVASIMYAGKFMVQLWQDGFKKNILIVTAKWPSEVDHLPEFVRVLHKPFNHDDLINKVKECLDEPRTG